jgi:hypothetical protein
MKAGRKHFRRTGTGEVPRFCGSYLIHISNRQDHDLRRRKAEERINNENTARLNLRAVTGLSVAFGLALTLASLPAAAQQWTPKQRAACEPDAMRLCNQYIPDVQRVSACMSAYRRYLSPACRAVLYGGQKKVRRR